MSYLLTVCGQIAQNTRIFVNFVRFVTKHPKNRVYF